MPNWASMAMCAGACLLAGCADPEGGRISMREPIVPPASQELVRVDVPVGLAGSPAAGKAPLVLAAGTPVTVDAGLAVALHLALTPDDLRALELRLPVAGRQGDLHGAEVAVYALPAGDPARPALLRLDADAVGTVLDLSPLAIGLADLARRRVDALELRLEHARPEAALLLRRLSPAMWGQPNSAVEPAAFAVLARQATHALFPNPGPQPRPGVWNRVADGHFDYGGQRLRLWGPVVHWRALGDSLPDRLVKMGANAVRVWGPPQTWYTPEAVRTGTVPPGNADMERFDRFIACCRARGLFVMTPLLAGDPSTQLAPRDINGALEMGPAGKALLDDTSWIAGGDDWAAWKAAVSTPGAPIRFARYFDERLDRLRRRHAELILDHVNPHTGRRWAEEEAVALWELDNENGFVHYALHQGFATWPGYFRAKLQQRWNAWLAQRHPDRAALQLAWGALGPDEDPAAGSVALAPVLAEAKLYPAARGAELVRFLVGMTIDWNRDFTAFCRSRAPVGTGIAVQPVSTDTLFQNDPAWLYANVSSGDVNCFGTYSYALTTALDKPPAFYVLDHNTVAGKPTVLYEVNAGRPNPFRSEFPFRIAATAAWQDWDGAFWHLSKAPLAAEVPDEHYLSRALLYPEASDYTTCVNHQYDPAMSAATALAGNLFIRGLLAPAPHPVTFTVGAEAIFSLAHLRGLPLGRSAFGDGARIAFAPESASVMTADRAVARPPADHAEASGAQILWDWPNRRLVIDAPQAKVYVGPDPGTWRFADGVAIGEFGAPWAVVAVLSADGRPLSGAEPSRRILFNAVADAWNTGFHRDPGDEVPGGAFVHPLTQRKRISATGTAPVVQQAVACTVWLPRNLDGTVADYDFATRRCGGSVIANGNRIRRDGPAVFLSELTVAAWGGPAAVPPTTPPPQTAAGTAVAWTAARHTGAWLPVAGLDWAMGADEAHQSLRDGTLRCDSVGPIRDEGAARSILVNGLELFSGTADVQFAFVGGRLARLTATFSASPGITEAARRVGEGLGRPQSETLRANAFETSTVAWRTPSAAGLLTATLGETQGVLSLQLACEPASGGQP